MQDLKEVTVYTEALEAENETLKQSLETERAAVADLITKYDTQTEAYQKYATALVAQNKELKRKGTVKNWLTVGLGAAVIALIATR